MIGYNGCLEKVIRSRWRSLKTIFSAGQHVQHRVQSAARGDHWDVLFPCKFTALKQTSTHTSALLFSLWQSLSDDCDPHEGIHEGKEGKYRLQVTQFVQRLEYWHKELANTLVTSINVVQVHGRAVAYLGTADGRHIQVKNRPPFFCCCSLVRHLNS